MRLCFTRFGTTPLLVTLLALLCNLCPPQLMAQSNTTALSGTVTDASGAVVTDAAVTISNVASGAKATKQTSSKGEYSFEQVQPGTYEVQVVASGFKEQNEQVQLLVSTPTLADFKLRSARRSRQLL